MGGASPAACCICSAHIMTVTCGDAACRLVRISNPPTNSFEAHQRAVATAFCRPSNGEETIAIICNWGKMVVARGQREGHEMCETVFTYIDYERTYLLLRNTYA